jgi:hypothetical protein
MSESLEAFLTARGVDTETIHQAARYYLAERTEDLPVDDMKEDLANASQDPAEVEAMLADLERDPNAIEQGALALLSAAWDDPAERERVESAIDHARGKLPVIEVGILAVVVMYGLYLQKTGGLKTTETVVERTADGRFRRTTRSSYFDVGTALGSVVKLFTGAPPPGGV